MGVQLGGVLLGAQRRPFRPRAHADHACDRDFSGVFNELHYTPAADGYAHTWSKVVGAVRFIGLDGNETWKKDNPRYKWLENELTNAKEKFVVVLDGYPGYSSGVNSKRRNSSLDQTRGVVLPLLGKHKATLMLCGWDPDYERCEPTPDKGATQIVTGCIGKAFAHRWSGALGLNPFGPGPQIPFGKVVYRGHEWCGWIARPHYCAFEVTGDLMEMNVRSLTPGVDEQTGTGPAGLLDHKRFKAR